VLIGSGLHIYCGAAEFKHVRSSRGALQIELTDAGARDGDLFVYCHWPLLLKTATGCAVAGIAQAGENVWRISLAGRQCGVPQRLVLNVLLPVTRQTWFWLLLATVAASLLFAASRYVVGQRLQRQHALAEERSRIARDLHARAREITLHIGLQGRLLEMSVADDGVGFDPAALRDQTGTHNGLANIRQRMAEMDGTCEIHSAPGQGTRVLLQIRIKGLP